MHFDDRRTAPFIPGAPVLAAGTLVCSGSWEKKTRAKLKHKGESIRLAPASIHPARQSLSIAGAVSRQRPRRSWSRHRSASSGHTPAEPSFHPSADLVVAAGHQSGRVGLTACACCFLRCLAACLRRRLLGCSDLLLCATSPAPLRLLSSRFSPLCRRFLLLPLPSAVRAMVCGGLRPGVR